MTKEELKQEAEEFTDSKKSFWRQGRTCIDSVKQAYIAGAEPREKQIEIDAIHIRALQKQNGELTDKVNDLEDKLANADYQLEGRDNEIMELEAQIEKMKNCRNCNKLKKEKDGLLVCTVGSFYTNCFGENCDKWEIKEK